VFPLTNSGLSPDDLQLHWGKLDSVESSKESSSVRHIRPLSPGRVPHITMVRKLSVHEDV
jgi:hypothetical protein